MLKCIKILFLPLLLLSLVPASAQIVEEIVGVVGDKIILRSEIEIEYERFKKTEGTNLPPNLRCEILNQKLVEKMMLHKADLDSVVVDEARVDAEMNDRIYKLVRQFGSEAAFEKYYGKSIAEIKNTNRDKVRDDLVVEEMKQKILKDVKASPTDVKNFYNSIPKDSLPFYSAEVEVAQIVKTTIISKEAKQLAYERIKEIRNRILSGEDFSTMAILYSDDPVSAKNGGELGFFPRGAMVAEFDAMAFKLRPDSVSKIIETQFGYHILKLIDRKGESVNVRHILIRPQITRADMVATRNFMDSLFNAITKDTLRFEDAAKKYSEDMESSATGGYLRDPATGSTRVMAEDLEKDLYLAIEKMKAGEVSQPELITMPDGTQVYRMIYLKSETKPHMANLNDDYQKYQLLAAQKKQQETLSAWVEKYRKKYYVKVGDDFRDCPTMQRWINNQ